MKKKIDVCVKNKREDSAKKNADKSKFVKRSANVNARKKENASVKRRGDANEGVKRRKRNAKDSAR